MARKAAPRKAPRTDTGGTASADEVARFTALAEEWWDPRGKFRPLHAINPTRITFIRDRVAGRLGRDPLGDKPLRGLDVLDIGCGGGLLAEPMQRLGARVTGIDAGQENVQTAIVHAQQAGLDIEYRCILPEALAADGRAFDVVLNMEVVEHVPDLDAFLDASCHLVKPGGIMVAATLNRTLKALALAKFGAEYVLGWLPRGTHNWRKFVRPSEFVRGLRPHGVEVVELKGVSYRPLANAWVLSRDLDVNYLVFAVKEEE